LREDRGLVYSVECRATSLSDIGTFDFDVQVRPEKVTLVAYILFEEIKKILQDGISDDELAHVKKRYLYDLDYDQDDPYKYIVRYGLAQMYSTEISVEKEKAILEGIAKEDLMRLAGEIFVPAKLNVVLLGPVTPELEKEIKKVTLGF
jgi:zinc protease